MNLLFMANNGLPRNGLVALYDMGKQIALGNTGQTLVDFTGRGNSAQLGSTAGADTNDPAYSGQGLTFGTDDYCKSSSSAFNDLQQFTVITVCKANSLGGGGYGKIWDKHFKYVAIAGTEGDALKYNSDRLNGSDIYIAGNPVPKNTTMILAVTGNSNVKMYYNATAQTVSKIASGTGDHSDAAFYLYLANRSNADRNFDGTIYLQAWYNRIISDTEYMQAYNYLKRLMLSRGITI